MPSPKHPCAQPGCTTLINKKAVHCLKHHVKTPEHIRKIRESNMDKTISLETRAKISKAHSGPGEINRFCLHCGKPFTAVKPSSKVRFCSRRCGYDQRMGINASNWLTDMPHFTCRVCGKDIRSHARNVPRMTCSYTCKNIWQLTHQPNNGTNIERITQAALVARGWNFQTQAPLCNVTVADFLLPQSKTIIFCDGDYWHSLPGKAEHDARCTAILETNGYTVYRFLGSAILASVDSCLDQITHRSSVRT